MFGVFRKELKLEIVLAIALESFKCLLFRAIGSQGLIENIVQNTKTVS